MLLQVLGVLSHFENFYVVHSTCLLKLDWIKIFIKEKLNAAFKGLEPKFRGPITLWKNFYVEPQHLNDWLEPD